MVGAAHWYAGRRKVTSRADPRETNEGERPPMTSLIDQHEELEPARSDAGCGDRFADVMERRISRRGLLGGGAAASALVVGGATALRQEGAAAAPTLRPLGFGALPPTSEDAFQVAGGHRSEVLLRWGDPVVPGAPAFDPNNQRPEAQAMQFGYNADFIGFLPFELDPNRALLCVNHEYTNSELMFSGYDEANPTPEQNAIEMAAHGMSIVEIQRIDGRWRVVPDSEYNRRITASTEMALSGPAAGSELTKTHEDPSGRKVYGMLNNCAGGKTPWGTVLTAEENFHQYFANGEIVADGATRADLDRYGIDGGSAWGWEQLHDRYDCTKEPFEANRFGWVVEVDPFNPGSTPQKRTALGRFRHEGAALTVSRPGNVVLYSGDDAYFEYIYKFVSAQGFRPDDLDHNRALLDDGTLYVARLNDDGSGEWLPLVHGQGPLTGENGFRSQADVMVRTRQAADLLGATKMDRPEDAEANPVTGKVYVALTKNPRRGSEGNPGPDAANPRPDNKWGHVIEITERDGDHTATTFLWEVFLLCGDPADESTYYAGYPKDQVSAIAAPDNVTFDLDGNLWIATDGQPSSLQINDSLYAVPTEGEARGAARRFLSVVEGGRSLRPRVHARQPAALRGRAAPRRGRYLRRPRQPLAGRRRAAAAERGTGLAGGRRPGGQRSGRAAARDTAAHRRPGGGPRHDRPDRCGRGGGGRAAAMA